MLNTFFKNINLLKVVLLLLVFLMPIAVSDGADIGGGGSGGSGTAATVDPSGIISIFCNVINQITNGVGKVIAILILISMAIGLFLGKITWGLAIAVMVGMGMLFGASGVVDTIAPKSADGTKDICKTVSTPD